MHASKGTTVISIISVTAHCEYYVWVFYVYKSLLAIIVVLLLFVIKTQNKNLKSY